MKSGMPKDDQKEEQTTSEDGQRVEQHENEQLVREHIGWMLALAQRLVGERSLAEDAVQDAFIAAFRALPAFEGRSSIKTWLHRITVNACLMILRKHKRLAEQPIDEYLPEFDRNNCRIEAPWGNLATAEEILDNQRLRTLVAEKVAMLPDTYRIVFQLRDIEQYDTGEVAVLLDISVSNVKVRLHRARAALKKLLEPLLRGEVQQ